MFIAKLAWRNIWRNKRRSLIVIFSIVVGVSSSLINDSYGVGIMNQMVDNLIKSHDSNVQIHKSGFRENKKVGDVIPNSTQITSIVKQLENINGYTERVICFGLISSAANSSGVSIVGLKPELEKNVTDIHKKIVDGRYLSFGRNEIVISKKVAEKLEVEIGDKVVAVASDINGNVSSQMFRVVGIYRSGIAEYDNINVYVPLLDAQEMLNIGDNIHEIAISIPDYRKSSELKNHILAEFDKKNIDNQLYEVKTFQEIMPMMMAFLDVYHQWSYIIYLIIGIAVLFGVVNTMLMTVMERINEFGVIMSIGIRRGKLVRMIIYESLFMGLIGTITGFIVGLLIYYPMSIYGIDMSKFSESMASFGLPNLIYPELNINVVINTLLIIPLVTMIAGIFPAIKAIRLQPSEAVRFV
ncbi:MAG: ABC transporter permease [Candidatus Kapabacteria bacterium]|nr:ABC transporter permease [Candidatus Kapabacteria bacterium]